MWHIKRNGKTAGPIQPDKLADLIRSGKVQGTDLVWMEGMAAWIPANSCPEWVSMFLPPASEPDDEAEMIVEVPSPIYQKPLLPIVNPLKRSLYVIRCAWALSLVMFVIFWAIMPPGDGLFINQHWLSIKLQGEIGWGILLMLCTADILAFHVIETLIQLNANIERVGQTDEG